MEALCWKSSDADVVQARGVAEREVRVKRCWRKIKKALGIDGKTRPQEINKRSRRGVSRKEKVD